MENFVEPVEIELPIRDRAWRRAQLAKRKVKAKWIMQTFWGYTDKDLTPDAIGHAAGTHCRACSCWMCGNPRRYWNELTVQERKYGNLDAGSDHQT